MSNSEPPKVDTVEEQTQSKPYPPQEDEANSSDSRRHRVNHEDSIALELRIDKVLRKLRSRYHLSTPRPFVDDRQIRYIAGKKQAKAALLAIMREARIDELHQLDFYSVGANPQKLAELYTHVLLRLRELNKEEKA